MLLNVGVTLADAVIGEAPGAAGVLNRLFDLRRNPAPQILSPTDFH